jgi:hypothetical protein
VVEYFTLFQKSWFLGLLSLDLLYILNNADLSIIYLALFTALKRNSESLISIALTLGLLGIAAYFVSNTAFEMLSLSHQYAAAATDVQRATFLAAGQSMLAIYSGTAFDMYYVLNATALLIFSSVMLRTNVFSRATAYVGLLAGKPYNGILFNTHKLIALGDVVITSMQIYRVSKSMEPQALITMLIVVAGLGVVSLFATGALMSAGKLPYNTMLTIHRIALILTTLAMALMVYLLTGRKL